MDRDCSIFEMIGRAVIVIHSAYPVIPLPVTFRQFQGDDTSLDRFRIELKGWSRVEDSRPEDG